MQNELTDLSEVFVFVPNGINLRRPRTAMYFSFFLMHLLSRLINVLSRYLDITKVVFSWYSINLFLYVHITKIVFSW